MHFTVACPGCGHRYKLPEHLAGKSLRCKKCNGVIVTPAVEAAVAPVAVGAIGSSVAVGGVAAPPVRGQAEVQAVVAVAPAAEGGGTLAYDSPAPRSAPPAAPLPLRVVMGITALLMLGVCYRSGMAVVNLYGHAGTGSLTVWQGLQFLIAFFGAATCGLATAFARSRIVLTLALAGSTVLGLLIVIQPVSSGAAWFRSGPVYTSISLAAGLCSLAVMVWLLIHLTAGPAGGRRTYARIAAFALSLAVGLMNLLSAGAMALLVVFASHSNSFSEEGVSAMTRLIGLICGYVLVSMAYLLNARRYLGGAVTALQVTVPMVFAIIQCLVTVGSILLANLSDQGNVRAALPLSFAGQYLALLFAGALGMLAFFLARIDTQRKSPAILPQA